ncbi:hypothetical protein V8E53_001822 [Lactarius tabidus]
MADTYRMPDNVAKAIGYVAEALQHIEQQRSNNEDTKPLPELFKSLQNNLSAEMDKQEQLNTVAKEIGQAAESLKASINDMGNSIAQVTDTSSQLASTATNYKDTLLKSSEQPRPCKQENPTQTDPKILREVDRKARQILIDMLDPKIQGASLTELKEKRKR